MIKLGRTELEINRIGFGGIPIQRITKEETKKLIQKCKEEGINFIDTARGYTVSEEYIGYGIKEDKDYWIIATKSMARDYDSMKKDIEISLRNLGRDYIDLYQIHNLKEDEYEKIFSENGAYRALEEAKKEGKIREIGITSHSVNSIEKAVECNKFSTIQFPYNIVENQGEKALIKAKEKNIGTIIMKPLAGGALDNGRLALRYILSKEFVDVVIPGMDNIDQVIENIKAGKENNILTESEIKEINKIKKELGNKFCRRCGYCLPCKQGINIPMQFLLEGYYTRYNLKEWALDRYRSLGNGASTCTKCGVCEQKCPYYLPIMDMLENVANVLEKE
ncbi:Predicted oxidoreductase of the aldo/keto reductase family [Alkalithermobacter thermoalcaliphilus JW-YL-7 = DSM 7308]|uniref:NADP-dependent oxidoreductase domain containing protein n=1 Tax=Alkalithermobacter thermoalcaliphilus JW-YL-7 = DSM 7308 TaxID=1121328 RepID=A0A150FS53_CLOPD|nr:NADP-dependent oxidoreductase domain containing protein [[Clostridium] paradoxum JW-YL-7 = DSM 7308]SHL15264.1 Predicted oxidoreductase of the aldo/keto reductase family [[Clostridium] paradoxum JW-YL-7 = DSM 7308]